jgi:hypothetical protein
MTNQVLTEKDSRVVSGNRPGKLSLIGIKASSLVVSLAAIAIMLLGWAPSLPCHNRRPLLGPGAYQLSGSFGPGGALPETLGLEAKDQPFLQTPRTGDHQPGRFISSPFAAPSTLSFFVLGYPSEKGNALYLQAEGRPEKLDLALRSDPGDDWLHFSWTLPRGWRGRSVRLVAEDNSSAVRSWVGLTLPCGESPAASLADSGLGVLLLLGRIFVEGTLFLVPGLAIARWVHSRHILDRVRFVSCVLIGGGIAGYLAFWPYLINPVSGKVAAVAILSLSLVALFYAKPIEKELLRALLICVALMILVTTFYSAIGFVYNRSDDPGVQAERRFVWALPEDNILPNMLVDDLYSGKPFKPFLYIDWKSSDRPPLQSAIVLLQRPLWLNEQSAFDYQILGTLLQSMWIASLWLLMQSLSASRRVVAVVCGFSIFSGFFVLHTFFIWPKLLAAAYFILALAAIRFPEGRVSRCNRIDTMLGGAAIALAMLSHGGIVFSVIALAIVLLASRQLPPISPALWGIAILLLLILPWSAYQKFYDPPGDRLLKWHLAGVIDRDSRSFGQAFVDAYSKVPFSQILANKIINVHTLIGPGPWEDLRQARMNGASQSKRLLQWYKAGTFFFFFQMLGVLNLGFLAFLFARAFSKELKHSALISAIQRLFVLAFVSLAVWCLLIYIPGGNVIHNGSYGTVLLLFAALSASLVSVVPRLTYVLLGFQVSFLFPVFALTDAFMKSRSGTVFAGGADPGMACLAALSLLTLLMLWSSEGVADAPRSAATQGGINAVRDFG